MLASCLEDSPEAYFCLHHAGVRFGCSSGCSLGFIIMLKTIAIIFLDKLQFKQIKVMGEQYVLM